MDLSIFLAKIFGLYFLIAGSLWHVRKDVYEGVVKELYVSKALLAVSGFISLSVGLAVAIGHPVYTLDWRGLITLFGYLAIVKGVVRIGFPDFARRVGQKVALKYSGALLVILFLLGLFLTYHGFVGG